jgi:uncharacterized protein YgiM (DUF1202 family)
MKLNFWLLFGTMLSTGLLAQQVTNAPPAGALETPAPAPMATNAAAGKDAVPTASGTNAPAAQAGKKKAASKKKAAPKKKVAGADLKTVPLVAGPAVVGASNVNVRGQAKLKSEVVGRLTKGQQVTVVEEITRNNSGPEEPSAWAKILLPADVHVWVNTAFIDATNKTVLPRRLNLRAGAGENYSVLGRLERGAAVKEVGTKAEWTEIEAPTNAYAFVAAQYLKQPAPGETPAAVALVESPATNASPAIPAPPATTVAEAAPIVAATTETPATPPSTETPAVTNAPTESATTTTNEPAPAVAEEPPPKRIVDREGIVRGTFSIQAPTHFELYSPETGHTIDWLYTPSPNLDLRRYKGLRIVVTGEEAIEERWGNTPVITIQKIQVLE